MYQLIKSVYELWIADEKIEKDFAEAFSIFLEKYALLKFIKDNQVVHLFLLLLLSGVLCTRSKRRPARNANLRP